MVSRKALIIGSPDEKIPGVNVDVKNIKEYLKSPVGGLWYDGEVQTLISPSVNEIRRQIEALKASDYSLVFFAGHGYHSIERKRTILHVNPKETLDSLELRVGAQKHTLILDCCRKSESDRRFMKSAMEAFALDSAKRQSLNPLECRRYFEKALLDCDDGLVVMNSCSINETAGENESDGGYYTASLIDSANEWAERKLANIDLTAKFSTSSTQDRHDAAAAQVKILSGGRQTPNFESPRTAKKFPFAVVA